MTVSGARNDEQVVVIGAGLGGLSAACHLAGSGHEVVVLEAANVPGGRAGTESLDGFRFDTGPTVLTMPHLIERCFTALGADMADHLTLRPVDPMYRACYADGSELRVRHGRAAMTAEVAAVCGRSEADAFERFCDWLTELYELEMPRFIERNFDSPLDLVRPFGPALDLVRLGAFRKLGRSVARYFTDDRLRRIFSFQAMYAGLAPYEALSIYAVITYMDTVNGVFVPEGGMHALPTAMAAAAEKAGVTFRYGTRVERILLRDGTSGPVHGVRLERMARWSGPRSSSPTRTCPSPTARSSRGLPAPRRARGADTRRRPRSGTSACGASSPPAPSTTTSTSAAPGTAPSGPSCTTALGCPIRRSS